MPALSLCVMIACAVIAVMLYVSLSDLDWL